MKYISFLVFAFITTATFLVGLALLGYSNVWQVCFHILILAVISRFLIGCYNELIFRINLEKSSAAVADAYFSKNLPPPRKYGYKFDSSDLEKWHGQTYLEEITADPTVDELTRIQAKAIVNDIHIAEQQDWIQERRLMRVALEAMKKYDKLMNQLEIRKKAT
ncbi:MAG: hypothetical protein ACLQHK_08485 [Gallionellaceae bacterium]